MGGMRLDETLKRLVEARGPSNREVSRQVSLRLQAATGREGVSATTVGTWLTPEGDPRLSELRALADYFEMSVAKLIGEAPSADALAPDEAAALDFYRDIRAAVGDRRALKEMAALAARLAGPPPSVQGHPLVGGGLDDQGEKRG